MSLLINNSFDLNFVIERYRLAQWKKNQKPMLPIRNFTSRGTNTERRAGKIYAMQIETKK